MAGPEATTKRRRPTPDDYRAGAVAIWIALLVAAIIGFVSLGVEVVLALQTQRKMQSAADDAALAAATANYKGYPSPYTSEAYAMAAADGFTAGQGAGCAATAIPTIYAGAPCDGAYMGNNEYVEVLIRDTFTLSMAKVVFGDDFVLHGRAVATVQKGCVAVLEPAGGGTFKVNGGAVVTLSRCSAWVKSTSSGAAQVAGGATLTCNHLYVGGTASGVNTSICPTTVNAHAVDDPYADVATPSASLIADADCTTPAAVSGQGYVGPAAGKTVVKLCAPGIDLTGAGQTLNLCPGVYIIDGGLSSGGSRSKFKLKNGSILKSIPASNPNCSNHTGAGVAIVLTATNASEIPQVDVGPGNTMTLDGLAAADSTTGLPVETLFFQDRRAANNQRNTFYGTANLNGILYFASEPVVFNGNSTTGSTCFEIIAWNLEIGGNPTLKISGCAFGTTTVAGQPVLVE